MTEEMPYSGEFDCWNSECPKYHEVAVLRYSHDHRPRCRDCGKSMRLIYVKLTMDPSTKRKLRELAEIRKREEEELRGDR